MTLFALTLSPIALLTPCLSPSQALEIIPYTLAENAGLPPIQIVTELRNKHHLGMASAGIHVTTGTIVEDMSAEGVVQPLLVNLSEISLATECVGMILKIDDLVPVR